MNRFLLPLSIACAINTAGAVPLVNFNDTWRYRKGTSAPQTDWKTVDAASLDASWLSGAGWIGFGDGSGATAAGTTLSDMQNGYKTFYTRITFAVPAGTPLTDNVVLSTDFDDGFVAWLDGTVRDRDNVPASPVEPLFNAPDLGATHEASFGSSGSLPKVTTLGTVNALGLTPGSTHTLAVMLVNANVGSSDAVLKVNLYTEAAPPPLDLHWTIDESPVTLTATFNVAAGQELIIDQGVEVRCLSSADAITCAGKIRAEGTQAQPIRFVRASAGSAWRRIVLSGTQESIFRWCDFDGANTSGTIRGSGTSTSSPAVLLENCRFLNTDVQMVDLVYTSCNIINCEFDSIGAQELLHFSNMPATGHALVKGCRFGLPGVPPTSGYNDIIDFTGGNRPGPIARFIDNIFLACVDDCFDMDATDAHIEGNIFLNVQQGGPRASSSNPITTGEGTGVSELVICRNFFYNCEHLLLLKDSGAAVLQNNTFLKMIKNPNALQSAGGAEIPPGIILFGEPWRGRPLGAGAIYEGNIAWDLHSQIQTTPFPLFSASTSYLRVNRSLIQGNAWPGTGNLTADPLFVSADAISYTTIRTNLALQPGSPARGTGPNGLDMGATVPAGASVSGAPVGTVSSRSATLTVGGPGIWAYRWRLNGGAWSADVPLVPATVLNGGVFSATMYDNPVPVTLTNLPDGPQVVEVIGRNSGGDWQDVPVSRTWNVLGDADADGMPDAWEAANGLDQNNAGDAALDTDGDSQTNLDEYIAGTNPADAGSRLLAATSPAGAEVQVSFPAVAGKSYRIQVTGDLATPWQTVQSYPVQSAAGTLSWTDPDSDTLSRRFYRVITP